MRRTARRNPDKRSSDRAAARKFWKSLSTTDRWEIGDQLVLGDLDYEWWFGERRPSAAFLDELDKERLYWEETR
jgi:hypothetical protein